MWMTNRSLYLYPICLIAFVLASGNRSWSADPGLAGPAPAPDRSATAGENDAVDDYIAVQMRKPHIPGLSLAIVRSGQVVKAKGYGFANLELRIITRIGGADAGVLFCRRADWKAAGGFNEARLYAEDVQFLFDLKRLGRARGQAFARAREVRTITSARKFDKHGDWHYFKTFWRGCWWLLLDRSAFQRFARSYWYDHR
jgi:hypothetical protein